MTIKRLWVSLAYFNELVFRLSGRHGVLAYFVYYGKPWTLNFKLAEQLPVWVVEQQRSKRG